jgi:hypothetical protein
MTLDNAVAEAGNRESLTATESVVAALWREALQMPELPEPTDNFFSLGGDSMTMSMVEFRIKEELSVVLPAGSIVAVPSLRELSALIDRGARQSDSEATKPSQGT